MELFLSDARGQYIPRDWALCVRRDCVEGVSEEDYAVLEAGPEHEFYWDTWTEVCGRASVTDPVTKRTGSFVQNGDLWLVFDDEQVPDGFWE